MYSSEHSDCNHGTLSISISFATGGHWSDWSSRTADLAGKCCGRSGQDLIRELEKSSNSPLYTKDILKKRFKIDTVTVLRIGSYSSLADSLAYAGKVKKVYGPYGQGSQRFLVQILAKAPNTFYHISQIYIDTSVFRYRFADSLGNKIIEKLNSGADSFEHLSQTYSMGGETVTKGDLGWVARGTLMA